MIEEAEAMESWRREFQLSEWAVFLIEMMEQEGKSEVEVRNSILATGRLAKFVKIYRKRTRSKGLFNGHQDIGRKH